jgi:hypothetical protein
VKLDGPRAFLEHHSLVSPAPSPAPRRDFSAASTGHLISTTKRLGQCLARPLRGRGDRLGGGQILVHFIARHGLAGFAYYRLALAVALILFYVL